MKHNCKSKIANQKCIIPSPRWVDASVHQIGNDHTLDRSACRRLAQKHVCCNQHNHEAHHTRSLLHKLACARFFSFFFFERYVHFCNQKRLQCLECKIQHFGPATCSPLHTPESVIHTFCIVCLSLRQASRRRPLSFLRFLVAIQT